MIPRKIYTDKLYIKSVAITLTCILSALPTFANVVKITHPDWPEGVLLTPLAAALLEEHMGHTVELTVSDPEAIEDRQPIVITGCDAALNVCSLRLKDAAGYEKRLSTRRHS